LVIVRRCSADDTAKTVSLGCTEWFVEYSLLIVVQLTPFTVKYANTVATT